MMTKPLSVAIIIACIIALGIVASSISSIAAPPAPPLPPVLSPTPGPNTGGSGGSGGSGGYITVTPTPTPVPTPVPADRISVSPPTKLTVNNVPVRIEGDRISVQSGYLLSEAIENGTFEVAVPGDDNASCKLVISVEPSGSQTGTIKSMYLIANKTLQKGDQVIGVSVNVSLTGLPAESSLGFELLDPVTVNMDGINAQMAEYGYAQFSTVPMFAFRAIKSGLQNGADITGATLTFTVPRPADFDPGAQYSVVRESDGAYDLLKATLVSNPDADPLTFEVVSPRGLSTFSLVKAATNKPVITPYPEVTDMPTVVPTSTTSSRSDGNSAMLPFITLAIGAIAGMGIILVLQRTGKI